ncbi:DUF7261 family protein [Halocatena halophila]|uniref:DUF7261 family protein n=1 Tax=Halocatena halophila TaxID=2814576 RepID=UPI002ED59DC1
MTDRGQFVLICAIVIVIACLCVSMIEHRAATEREPKQLTTDRDRVRTTAQELQTATAAISASTPNGVREQLQTVLSERSKTTDTTAIAVTLNESATQQWASTRCPSVCPVSSGLVVWNHSGQSVRLRAVGIDIQLTGIDRTVRVTTMLTPRPTVVWVRYENTSMPAANETTPAKTRRY